MNKMKVLLASFATAITLAACSNAPKLATQPMPRSGFLPDYNILVPMASSDKDTRIWRYRISGVNPGSYTAVILDPIYLNQNATKSVNIDDINKAKAALQASMVEAVNSRGTIKIVNKPGPGVARISVGITGAESSADSLQPWNFTPIGLAMNAAAYAGGVNSKTPALLVESKITDSQSKQLLGEGLITIQGESFRTNAGSADSFVAMAKKVVRSAMETSANPVPTGQ
ncbi:DUF3313 domain-containing protein [Polynucleobacter sp. AP-Nickl1-40-C4]|uniref:DUF3313 domain-containing protein n=1 Tax=Polynucleobacter sp. AP-Nickl1-40-C4 TaxID=3108275 RepID=UPI002B234E27|nr:DUF3313 domain-containing protein [Polynucleobacter sp. AP-Nickl1-40-C4]MEA9567696.1 DUF3313 domain-containing protein [Polynucleobacter sp. AP-Nickl1-40-C4]